MLECTWSLTSFAYVRSKYTLEGHECPCTSRTRSLAACTRAASSAANELRPVGSEKRVCIAFHHLLASWLQMQVSGPLRAFDLRNKNRSDYQMEKDISHITYHTSRLTFVGLHMAQMQLSHGFCHPHGCHGFSPAHGCFIFS